MSVDAIFRAPGNLADLDRENILLTNIYNQTQNLGSENIRTEGINRIHFSPRTVNISAAYPGSSNNTTTAYYASSTYVHVNHGNPMSIDFGSIGSTIEPGYVVRFQWSVYIFDYEKAGNLGEYAFCLKTDTGGAGTFVQQSPDYWFSAMGYPIDGPSTSTYHPMINRRHTMSYIMVRSTPFTLYDARVDIKVENPWTVGIRNTNLFAIVQRH